MRSSAGPISARTLSTAKPGRGHFSSPSLAIRRPLRSFEGLLGLELIFIVTRGTPIKLIGDPLRLRQVCLNLLVNAIKFAERGQIAMRVEADDGSRDAGLLRFCVADSGAGTAPEEQKRIFTRFARNLVIDIRRP